MSEHKWKPGDVAMVLCGDERERPAMYRETAFRGPGWHFADGAVRDVAWSVARPLVVIDPDDRERVERLRDEFDRQVIVQNDDPDPRDVTPGARGNALQAAIRSLITPPKPDEPTDPEARVSDRRDNIWRLLADGDWVCTSGPDIGEYLVWQRLTERGPLSVEVTR